MVFDVALVLAGIFGAAVLLAGGPTLSAKPRRGTEWRPSTRAYRLFAIAPLLIAAGAAMNLIAS